MIIEYKLEGLSKPNSFTFQTEKEDIFWATSDFTKDRFNALFDYCKNNWREGKIAVLECDYITSENIPINAKVIQIKTKK